MRLTGHIASEDIIKTWHPVHNKSDKINIAIVLSPQNFSIDDYTQPVDRITFEKRHGVPPTIHQTIADWCQQNALAITKADPFIYWVSGSFYAIEHAFGIEFHESKQEDRRLYRTTVEPDVPDALAPYIIGVMGLENVSRLLPSYRYSINAESLANQGQGFFPQDIQSMYSFPPLLDGTGTTIGLLEFSNGYNSYDLYSFWQSQNIPTPQLTFVSVDGTPNDGGVNPWDMEATLDVEWAGAMAPGANIVVYEASAGSSNHAFAYSVLQSLQYAIHDTTHNPNVLSISYGDGESRFPVATMRAWDSVIAQGAALGITTFVASGDQGAYGLHTPGPKVPHVDAPANCPHAVAVGGTHTVMSANGSIKRETGWTDVNNNGASGGGISQVFGVPSYQDSLQLPLKSGMSPGRGVPDVSLNADPDTGYAIVFQGAPTVVGGTSCASPIWAALTALILQERAQKSLPAIGFFNPSLYALGGTSAFHDITHGNNSYNGVVGYHCTPGWDAVTGWGTSDGETLMGSLRKVQSKASG